MIKDNTLLLEIGCEEIPSRFIDDALKQMGKETGKLLEDSRLGYKTIDTWATPRRLVLVVNGLDELQPDLVEVKKGPPVNRAYDDSGKPTKALEGFLRKQGVGLEHVEKEIVNGSEYIIVTVKQSGEETKNLLKRLLPQLIGCISFPRPMYWAKKDIKFARPIRWLLAIYQDEPVEFNYSDLTSDHFTYGHRFISPGPFSVKFVSQYFDILKENYVILDQVKRAKVIRDQVEKKAAEIGGKALISKKLLEEVTYLVEYPEAIRGSFDSSFLEMPQEVAMTSMQYHQRYFPVTEPDTGKLMPSFIGVSNNGYHDNIRKGYEKVLQARLSDGRFFYEEDTKIKLEDYTERLKTVLFMESLGSLDQKRARLVNLAEILGRKIGLDEIELNKVKRVAHLCKADLATNLVNEFPELQGVMGREYALLSGELPEVADAIAEHYYPRYSGDRSPNGVAAALVSLADRLDTLVGSFVKGLQPTGSQDPYALRRQAQGALQIMVDLKLTLLFKDYLKSGYRVFTEHFPGVDFEEEVLDANLKAFFLQRVRHLLQEKKIAYDIIEAVMAVNFDTLYSLFDRAIYLNSKCGTELLAGLELTYTRIANLADKAGAETVNEDLLVENEEKKLFNKLKEIEPVIITAGDDYEIIMKNLSQFKLPVDDFFDHVMVMVDEQKIRNNRLNLLARIKRLYNRIADFSLIQ